MRTTAMGWIERDYADAATLVASIESGIAGLTQSPTATPTHAAAQESP